MLSFEQYTAQQERDTLLPTILNYKKEITKLEHDILNCLPHQKHIFQNRLDSAHKRLNDLDDEYELDDNFWIPLCNLHIDDYKRKAELNYNLYLINKH